MIFLLNRQGLLSGSKKFILNYINLDIHTGVFYNGKSRTTGKSIKTI